MNRGNKLLCSKKPQLEIDMSLETSTHLMIPEPAEESIATEPWAMETYADGLIDDLFAEIDSILEGSKKLPSQPQQQDSDWKPNNTSQVELLPSASNHLQRTGQFALPEDRRSGNNQLSTFIVNNNGQLTRKPSQKPQRLSKLLKLAAILGLAIAGSVWILKGGLFDHLASKSFQQALEIPQPQVQTKQDVEADFANYMLQALNIIEQKGASKYLPTANLALMSRTTTNRTALAYVRNEGRTGGNNLPPVLTANNTSPIPSSSTNVVERIYIPVYQPPLPMRYIPSPIPSIPTTLPPLPSTAKQATATGSQPALIKSLHNTGGKLGKPTDLLAKISSKLKPIDVKPQAISVQQAPQLLAPPKLPTPTAPQPEPIPTPQKAVSALSSANSPSYTLEGLLELGDKSAALFKINGVTRRVNIGESIGSSGWTLVDVANGEAIIRRNGEVRSIFAGQKF
jgi:hypothetical protein